MWKPFVFGDEDCDVRIRTCDMRSIDRGWYWISINFNGTLAHLKEGFSAANIRHDRGSPCCTPLAYLKTLIDIQTDIMLGTVHFLGYV
jgi:hypothetical protein